jgi:hypothetical protein
MRTEYWMRQPWLPGWMPSSARTQVSSPAALTLHPPPNHLSINQITRVCTETSGWEFSFKNFGCMEWEAGLERRGKGR